MLVPPADVVARAKATIRECTVHDVQARLDTGLVLIDIREPAEYARGHLPGAIPIPRGLLEFEILPVLEKLGVAAPAASELVLYCGTGGRSALATQALDAMGFENVTSMDGGIVAWTEAKLPLAAPTT